MRYLSRRFCTPTCALLFFFTFFVLYSQGQIAHFGKSLPSRQANSSGKSFSDLTSPAADPADAVCARSITGAVVSDPPSLSSQNGVLEVTFQYQTTVDENGLTRYCYVYTTASGQTEEAPTLEVNPGDQLIIHFYNDLSAAAASDASSHAMSGMKMHPAASGAPSDCSATSVTSASTNHISRQTLPQGASRMRLYTPSFRPRLTSITLYRSRPTSRRGPTGIIRILMVSATLRLLAEQPV